MTRNKKDPKRSYRSIEHLVDQSLGKESGKVKLDTPTSRAISTAVRPAASTCFNTPIICSVFSVLFDIPLPISFVRKSYLFSGKSGGSSLKLDSNSVHLPLRNGFQLSNCFGPKLRRQVASLQNVWPGFRVQRSANIQPVKHLENFDTKVSRKI